MLVAILYGAFEEGDRPDIADSLVQVDLVSRSLAGQGWDVRLIPISGDMAENGRLIAAAGPDLVFNLVDDIGGRGEVIHLVPSLLDQMTLAYTGSGSWSIYATTNKLVSKKIMAEAGLPVPDWWTLDALGGREAAPTGPVIVKSLWEHGSVGLDEDSVRPARDLVGLERLLTRRRDELGGEWFAESFIDGREFNIALLEGPAGEEVLPPAEIEFKGYGPDKPRVVGYRAKWDKDSYEYDHTVRRLVFGPEDESLLSRLDDLARRCWRLFEMSGYARVDFRVDRFGDPWILEVNANPCIAPDSGFMAAAERRGLSQADVIERIARAALAVNPDRRPGRPVERRQWLEPSSPDQLKY